MDLMIGMDCLQILAKFGTSSQSYPKIKKLLEFEFKELELLKTTTHKQIITQWSDEMKQFYGSDISDDLFLNQIYLALVAEFLLYEYFEQIGLKDDLDKFPVGLKIRDNESLNFRSWLDHVRKGTKSKITEIMQTLDLEFQKNPITSDIFIELYHDLIVQKRRHNLGEFYTPSWLSEYLVNRISEFYTGNEPIRYVDPSCGTGSFLVSLIQKLINEGYDNLDLILNSIEGIEINPITAYLANINYFLAIPKRIFFKYLSNSPIPLLNPIIVSDALKLGSKFQKFDVIIGNPPWVVMRNIPDPGYREFLKKLTVADGLIKQEETHLFTQMELAAIFFNRTADNLLKNGGLILNIMPISVIMGTKHLDGFRAFTHPPLKLLEILDLSKLNPVFSIPSCVLIAQKGGKTKYPVKLTRFSGNLALESLNPMESVKSLIISYERPKSNTFDNSYYFSKFKVGASIFPKSLFFVDLGDINDEGLLTIETARTFTSKSNWKNAVLKGKIDPKYVFLTLESLDMMPFGVRKLSPIVLPMTLGKDNSISLINVENLQEDTPSSVWFRSANELWKKYRTKKSQSRFPTLSDRLNYNELLTKQNLNTRFLVLYAGTGKNICSFVLDREQIKSHYTLGQGIYINDVKNWVYATNSKREAHYLCSILNSTHLNDLIKPMQPTGLGGPRAIHRKPLEFPIPKYNSSNPKHIELSDFSMRNHEFVSIETRNRTVSRKHIRQILEETLFLIDNLMIELI